MIFKQKYFLRSVYCYIVSYRVYVFLIASLSCATPLGSLGTQTSPYQPHPTYKSYCIPTQFSMENNFLCFEFFPLTSLRRRPFSQEYI